jgi:hypothetical protein
MTHADETTGGDGDAPVVALGEGQVISPTEI